MTAQRIETGTTEGDALGFTGELFSGWLELYNNSRLYLHYIISRHRNEGNTQALICSWLDRGYDVRVVMPRPIMQHILEKFGFVPSSEYLPGQYTGVVDVWYRPAVRERQDLRDQKPAAGCLNPDHLKVLSLYRAVSGISLVFSGYPSSYYQ